MATNKRHHDNPLYDQNRKARPNRVDRDERLGTTEGLFNDLGDGTLGDADERLRELVDDEGNLKDISQRQSGDVPGQAAREVGGAQSTTAGTNTDTTPGMPYGQGNDVSSAPGRGLGADDIGGMGTGTGRGRGSGIPGGVYGSGDSSGTGQMGGGFDSQVGTGGASGGLGSDVGGGLTGDTGGQGLARRSDQGTTGGGVAVSGGRGSDVGTVGGGMAPDLSSETTGGMSGGTMGGSRESDVGGGLSGGMRSGMGDDASGGRGGAGRRERVVEAEKAIARDQTARAGRRRRGKSSKAD